jgi:putative methionine-R-sulfoxide reductase with GAF domain
MVAIMDRNTDRSAPRLPDPIPGAPNGERRRCARQKLHTPVYASFNGPQTGMVVDLSELLDLNEDGFAVQTGERLEVNRAVTLCLDLPETRNFIHSSGQVMWSDDAGRGGIKFSGLSEESRKVLKEWLFANLLIASSNHNARTEQLARQDREKSLQPSQFNQSDTVVPTTVVPMTVPISVSDSVSIPNRSEISSSMEAVRNEVFAIGNDVDAIFQLITECAASFTGAGGAALAFLTNETMVCRARFGEPAPPLGAPVDIKQGLSGECVRTGRLVSCEDTESDPRVDSEVSRALGIGSLMAVPMVSDFRVVGLLEIFSAYPRSFTSSHGTILDSLVEMIPHPADPELATAGPENTESARPIDAGSIDAGWIDDSLLEAGLTSTSEASAEKETEVSEQVVLRLEPVAAKQAAPKLFSSWLQRALLGLAVAVVVMVVGYLVSPLVWKRSDDSPSALQSQMRNHNMQAKSLADLRTLAARGDAGAQYQMGVRYDEGEGVLKDDAQAVQWFQRAADQGNVDAQAHLGAYYWAGRGVPRDLSKAYMWSMIAVAGGDDNSKSRLQGLASQMTRAQVSAARQQAEEWIHTHTQQAKSEAN